MTPEQMIRMKLVEVTDIVLTRYESRLLPESTRRSIKSSGDARGLSELIDALLRVDSGRFGLCEECGEAISDQRLLESPTVPFCVNCSGHESWRPSQSPA
jgi:RNA polymerase-binding transcription factor DksA